MEEKINKKIQKQKKIKKKERKKRENNHEIHMETQKTSNSQSNSKQKVQFLSHHNTQPQTLLQSPNNKNSMVLAQKQTGRPVDQNRRRHKSTHL
jgi:hypothetical protein